LGSFNAQPGRIHRKAVFFQDVWIIITEIPHDHVAQAVLPNVLGQVGDLVDVLAGKKTVEGSEGFLEVFRRVNLLMPATEAWVFVSRGMPVAGWRPSTISGLRQDLPGSTYGAKAQAIARIASFSSPKF
jgi:hypothetical protein